MVPPNCLINVVLPRQEGKAEQRLAQSPRQGLGSTSLVTGVVPLLTYSSLDHRYSVRRGLEMWDLSREKARGLPFVSRESIHGKRWFSKSGQWTDGVMEVDEALYDAECVQRDKFAEPHIGILKK